MNAPRLDPRSMAGKALHVGERAQLLVIGAGRAGLAAALEAARLGLHVVVVDENPIPAETMGEDVPLHFGQRMSGAARNRNAVLEAFIESDPVIAEAFEAGVELRLGTVAFGLWAKGPSLAWLPGPVAGLVDGERSWLIGCDRVIVAAGRRDMGLAFLGWELPGVMGAAAAERLAMRYGALDARRAIVLGSSAEALAAALALRDGGVEIVAVVEHAAAPVGPAALLAALGAPVLTGHVVREAQGEAGVERVLLGRLDEAGRLVSGTERFLHCDTVLLGVGAVPALELLDALGARITFQPERGGHAPSLDWAGRTSVPSVYAVGDCAGIWPSKTLDPGVAAAEGRHAAADAAASLGVGARPDGIISEPDAPTYDLAAYWLGWVRACVVEACCEPHVCQCEEVTAREIMEVRPPRYLGWPTSNRNTDLRALLGAGTPNPDQVKRLTRAGMGPCQGRRCREQVAALIALSTGVPLGEVPLATHRAPVRPLPLGLAADVQEPAEMTEQWDTWFGMPTQWVPFWEIGKGGYTVAGSDRDGPAASE